MTDFLLIHGGGDTGWHWHLVAERLRAMGHRVVAPDMPCEDESARWEDYADVAAAAVPWDGPVTVVGQSLGGFTAPLLCSRLPVERLVLLAAMVPVPGESADEWWSASGHSAATEGLSFDDPVAVFLHDAPPGLAEEALRRGRDQAGGVTGQPWPLAAWPSVPTRYVLARDDRLLPAAWVRRMVVERLGIVADEVPGSHCVALTRPDDVAGVIG